MKLIDLLTEMLILEVGEGVEPYEYKITSSEPDHYEAIFNVTSREGKVLDKIKIGLKIKKMDSLPIKLLCGEIKYLHISFKSEKTSFHKTSTPIDKAYIEYRDEEERRQPFKIMSTVVSFVKEVLLSYEPSVKIISFSFSGGTEKEARQKEKLYRAYLSKELSKGEFDFVEPSSKVKKITSAKVIKRNTNDCLSYYFNEDETYNLSGANLSGANLEGADLRGADLSGANLSGANLRGASLSAANLSDTNLNGADLTKAKLSGANLNDAYLYRADLSGVTLYRADLIGANLTGTNLTGANLYGANLTGAYLYDANLTGAYLYEADLTDADLTGVKYNSKTKWPEGFSPN